MVLAKPFDLLYTSRFWKNSTILTLHEIQEKLLLANTYEVQFDCLDYRFMKSLQILYFSMNNCFVRSLTSTVWPNSKYFLKWVTQNFSHNNAWKNAVSAAREIRRSYVFHVKHFQNSCKVLKFVFYCFLRLQA